MEKSHDLPQVLLLKPALDMEVFGQDRFSSDKFRFLKAWESPLPLDQFLQAHAQSVQAMLVSGGIPVTAETIRLLPALKMLMTTGAGLNHIDMAECRRRGIAVVNAGSVPSEDVADLAVGLLIDVLRKVSASDRYVRRGLWTTNGDFTLGSKVVTCLLL